jgi:hypothetical protein
VRWRRSAAAEAGKRGGCRGETPCGRRASEASTKKVPVCGESGSQVDYRGETPRTLPAAGDIAHALGRKCHPPCDGSAARQMCSAAPLPRFARAGARTVRVQRAQVVEVPERRLGNVVDVVPREQPPLVRCDAGGDVGGEEGDGAGVGVWGGGAGGLAELQRGGDDLVDEDAAQLAAELGGGGWGWGLAREKEASFGGGKQASAKKALADRRAP